MEYAHFVLLQLVFLLLFLFFCTLSSNPTNLYWLKMQFGLPVCSLFIRITRMLVKWPQSNGPLRIKVMSVYASFLSSVLFWFSTNRFIKWWLRVEKRLFSFVEFASRERKWNERSEKPVNIHCGCGRSIAKEIWVECLDDDNEYSWLLVFLIRAADFIKDNGAADLLLANAINPETLGERSWVIEHKKTQRFS